MDNGAPDHGLYGPGDGILGTDIDLRGSNLPDRTILALGALMADMMQHGEAKGYERGRAETLYGWPSLPENVRMLITDAALMLQQAAENDVEVARPFAVWQQHMAAVVAGRFGRYALKTDGSGVDVTDGAR